MKIFANILLATVLAGHSVPNLFFRRGYSMPMVKRAALNPSELVQLTATPLEEDEQQKRGYSMPFYKRGYSMPFY